MEEPYILELGEVTAPMMVCRRDGSMLDVSPAARDVLAGLGALDEAGELPPSLRNLLANAPLGASMEWYPEVGHTNACLGLTCYHAGSGRVLVVMRELSSVRRALAQRFYEQRMSALGSMARGLAHDLRNALAGVVYETEIISEQLVGGSFPTPANLRLYLDHVSRASARLNSLVASLFEHGQPRTGARGRVDLLLVLDRVVGFLGRRMRDLGHVMAVQVAADAAYARANPLVLEEAVILLVESALDAAPDDVTLTVNLSTERRGTEVAVVVDVVEAEREGASSPPERFSARRRDEWLGLPMAREAVAPFAGRVIIESGQRGARAAIVLPGPSQAGGG